MKPFLIVTCLAGLCALSPLPLAAQEALILSPCQDGPGGASQTEEELGLFLQGTWAMTAAGTGFTTGTNAMPLTLRWDAAAGQLRMEGGGQGTPLTILRTGGDGTTNAPFDMSAEALTPGGLSQLEIEVLTGCATPLRYFWEMGSGAHRSWGGLMFHDADAAVGFMANSAGGTRTVSLARQ